MKRFKQLIKDNLKEWQSSGMVAPGSNLPGVGDHSMKAFNIENPEVLEQLNAFLQDKIGEREWFQPKEALLMARAKLQLVGLDFPFNPQESTTITDVMSYPLSQYGGRFGWDMESGDVTYDDGIEHRLGYPLNIEARFTKMDNGLYDVDASIVPAVNVGESTETIDLGFIEEYVQNIPTPGIITEDAVAARELLLYIENDATIYKRRLLPAYKNLITKMAREQYDSKKAAKLFMYTINDAAKSYAKEYSNGESNIFDKKTKEAVALEMTKNFEGEAGLGNYDDLLPKKYQK